jgi:hypothetical protein
MALRRILLGAFALYLFALLGYLGPSHRHEGDRADSKAHQDCVLCQMASQPYAAAVPIISPETPAGPVALVEAVWAPILASRFQPFASRAPPSA